MNHVNHDDWLEKAEIYALGALDGDESTQFETHLAAGCPMCADRLRETRETLALLPRSLTPIAPPSGVRARLLAQIAGEATSFLPGRPRSRRFPWGIGAVALAAACLLLALSWSLVVRQYEVARLEETVAALRAQLGQREESFRAELSRQEEAFRLELAQRAEALRQELARQEHFLHAALATREELLRFLADPRVRLVHLAGRPPSPGARGQLLWNPVTRAGVFLTTGLPQAPPDKVYELWAIADSKPVPAGTFRVDDAGYALLRLPALPQAKRFDQFAVTLEPAGGVEQPSGPMHLLGKL
jgi:anti-sigma-K factor RskA